MEESWKFNIMQPNLVDCMITKDAYGQDWELFPPFYPSASFAIIIGGIEFIFSHIAGVIQFNGDRIPSWLT